MPLPPSDPLRWLTWGPESAIRILLTQQSPPGPCRNGRDPGGWTIHPNATKYGGSPGGLMLFVSMAMRRALYCVPMAFKGLHYATARVARRLLPRLRGSEHGLKPATMVVVGQRRRAKPHTGGGRRGATRAREGARVRMVRETACGRTGGEGGSNAGGMAYWGGGRPAKRATVETTAAATATTAAVKGGGVADRACNIGAEGRWVCVHVHASLNPDPRLHA